MAVPAKDNPYGTDRTQYAREVTPVTPSDSVDLALVCRAISLTVAGDIQITTKDGTTVVITGLAAGIMHPIGAQRIWSTNTTATGIIAYF